MATYGNSDKKVGVPTAPVPPPYSYATAPAVGVPTMPNASSMPATYPGYLATGAYPYPQGPPPPYSVAVSQPTTVSGYPAYVSVGYPYGIPVYSQPGAAVVVPGTFDAGARFDSVARSAVPPPPPGVAPNSAQLALMQGSGSVIVPQQKSSFLSGGSGGGFTFW